ncbi:MAG TPA: GxxExxY protein [Candidatus Dormibacteraeota bacterium]|nr:GxxExxY protein [Candidatus Dormibacteraeota bacterium]
MKEEQATVEIIGAAIEVHRALGPGLLESVYEECLAVELGLRRLPYARQQSVPLRYKGQAIGTDLKIDLVVEDRVVVELKAVEKLLPVHEAQILTYLRLTGKQVGLLINFNVPLLKEGIRRFLNHPTLRVSVPPW